MAFLTVCGFRIRFLNGLYNSLYLGLYGLYGGLYPRSKDPRDRVLGSGLPSLPRLLGWEVQRIYHEHFPIHRTAGDPSHRTRLNLSLCAMLEKLLLVACELA